MNGYLFDLSVPFGRELGPSAQRLCAMQTYSYSVTDLDKYESEMIEVEASLVEADLSTFGRSLAREIVVATPDLKNKGLCLVLYDGEGEVISIAPIGSLN
jgi:hypothetical protein